MQAVPFRNYPFLLGLGVIFLAFSLNTLYLFVSPLDLAPDEAHYWDWSRRLDYCYYSKGPLVAWLIRGSCELFGDTVFAVRFPAVVCSSLTLMAFYLLARRFFAEKHALAALLLTLTIPAFAASAVLMTIDAPLLCCWAWALLLLHDAIIRDKRRGWLLAGGLIALGTLAKLTMLALPVMVAMYLIAERRRSTHHTRGLLTMTLLGSLGVLPILIWNMNHEWLSVRHLLGQAGLATGPKIGFKWYGPFDYLAGQLGFLTGYWFCAFAAAAWSFRPSRRPDFAFLWWLSVPMVLALVPFSLRVKVQPNWPAVAYLPGLLLAYAWLFEQLDTASANYRKVVLSLLTLGTLTNVGFVVVVRFPQLTVPLLASFVPEPSADRLAPLRNIDPTARLRGWKYLAGQVDKLRERVKCETGEDAKIATMTWNVPGELAFYCAGNPQVYSFGIRLDDRFSQYDVWRPNPIADAQEFAGHTFVYVGEKIPNSETVFENWDGPIRVEYRENGVTVGGWKLWIGRSYKGFPEAANKRRQY